MGVLYVRIIMKTGSQLKKPYKVFLSYIWTVNNDIMLRVILIRKKSWRPDSTAMIPGLVRSQGLTQTHFVTVLIDLFISLCHGGCCKDRKQDISYNPSHLLCSNLTCYSWTHRAFPLPGLTCLPPDICTQLPQWWLLELILTSALMPLCLDWLPKPLPQPLPWLGFFSLAFLLYNILNVCSLYFLLSVFHTKVEGPQWVPLFSAFAWVSDTW